jgi:hypothetical protein
MARWDTTQLANTVIRDAKIPAGSSYRDSNNAKILAIATEEQEAVLVPEIIKVQGGHLMAYADTTLSSSTIRYRLPERAIRPERVLVVNSSGDMVGRLRLASGDMVDEVLAGFMPRGDAIGYWVPENNHAVVALRDSLLQSGYSLRIFYRRQPNTLIATASAWDIEGVGDAPIYTFGEINTGDSPADPTVGPEYDIIRGVQPFEAVHEDETLATVNGGTLELTFTTDPGGLQVGDFLAPAGYTPVPQLPVAFHAVLAAFTTARVLREMGNTRAADLAQLAADRKLQSALTTITPRGDDAETTVDEVWLKESGGW